MVTAGDTSIPWYMLLTICWISVSGGFVIFAVLQNKAYGQEIEKQTKKKVKTDKQNTFEYHSRKSCSICLNDYSDIDIIKILPCYHIFHKSCVDQWIDIKNICPLCQNDNDSHSG